MKLRNRKTTDAQKPVQRSEKHTSNKKHAKEALRTSQRKPKRAAARPSTSPTPRRESPDWDLDPTVFPSPSERSQSNSPFRPSASPSPSSDDLDANRPEGGDDDEPDLEGETSQNARNAQGRTWLPWQDRALIREAEELRPFEAARGEPTRLAWDALALQLCTNSTAQGTSIDRTGHSCKARFLRLVKAHEKEQTRSLQKTGTNEEVDDHVQRMTEIAELYHIRKQRKSEKSAAAQRKIDVEAQAAREIRDSAMRGLVKREKLTDVAAIEGASAREKQGQRKRPRTLPDESDKENDERMPKRRRKQNDLAAVVAQRNEKDTERLREARERDDKRHAEAMALQERSLAMQDATNKTLGQVATSIAQLADLQRQNENNILRQRAEAAERHLELLRTTRQQ